MSESDEKNYNVIKEYLDILKPLVETSELWVYEPSATHSSTTKKDRKSSMNEDNEVSYVDL